MDPVQVTIALIAAGLIILIAFPIHEFSHALAAYRLDVFEADLREPEREEVSERARRRLLPAPGAA